MAEHIQKDWEDREFIETISISIKRIVEFLNRFDSSTRDHLARVNERITKLERQVDYLETSLASVIENTIDIQASEEIEVPQYAPPPPPTE